MAGEKRRKAITRGPRLRPSRCLANSPAFRRSRFLAALSKIRLRQYDEAFTLLKALLDESPTAAIYNNLGVVQARRGATPQTGRATYYFTKAAEADPDDPDYAFNVGYAYWFERDPQAAVYWLKEAVRRHPADGDAHYVLAAALAATGASVEAAREKELARQLSSTYEEWERRPNASEEPVPRGLERLRDEMDAPRLGPVDTTLAPAEQGPARSGRVPRRTRPADVRAAAGPAGRRGTAPFALPLPVPAGRAPAARPHLPADRPGARTPSRR